VGVGEAAGTTVNVALPAGCGDREYRAVFAQLFEPELSRFQPQLIVVSAGFDPHVDDQLGGMEVTDQGFAELARRIVEVADEVAGGRLVCVLEGGYNLAALGKGMVAVLDAMDPTAHNDAATRPPGEDPPAMDTAIAPAAAAAIARTRHLLAAVRGAA
jgi:acetoin utilization deacetylase AcuC-like enzyme